MHNAARWLGGALIGVILSAGALVAAAPGDLIYHHIEDPVQVASAGAAAIADWAIAQGAWSGNRADMTYLSLERSRDDAGNVIFVLQARGFKTGAVSTVPKGSRVEGYVE